MLFELVVPAGTVRRTRIKQGGSTFSCCLNITNLPLLIIVKLLNLYETLAATDKAIF